MAIYNYELKAKAFYDKKVKLEKSEDPQVINQLNQDYNHLESERSRIASFVTLQTSLENYRKANDLADQSTLMKESHHSPNRLSKYLTAAGEPKPTANHEAHHIIPGKGQSLQLALTRVRLNLHFHAIGINDPLNGVWLYGKSKGKELDWATYDAVSHRRIHRHNYEQWIFMTLRNKTSKIEFVNKLRQIKLKIKTGTMPDTVMMPKDSAWDGVS
jgi:hypothetical protein